MAGLIETLKSRWLTGQDDILKKFTNAEASMLQNTQGKKIYDCADNELKQTLAYCCLMVGIDKTPAEDKKLVLISFLRKYYGTLTNRQIAQAFELVATGELGHSVQEHYNNISPMYVSNVLRAYLQKLNGVKVRYETKKKLEETVLSPPEAYYNRLVKVIEGYNVIPMFWAWEEVHGYLCKSLGGEFARAASPSEKKDAVIKYLKGKYPTAMVQSIGNRV